MATRPRPRPAPKVSARKATTRTSAVAKASGAATPRPQAPAAEPAPGPAAKVQKATKSAKATKADKADKVRKPKLVRDSFTMPKDEYAVIDALKQRAARLGKPSKKSELLRAGVKALQAMTDDGFMACVSGVPSIKTGRPARA